MTFCECVLDKNSRFDFALLVNDEEVVFLFAESAGLIPYYSARCPCITNYKYNIPSSQWPTYRHKYATQGVYLLCVSSGKICTGRFFITGLGNFCVCIGRVIRIHPINIPNFHYIWESADWTMGLNLLLSPRRECCTPQEARFVKEV